MTQATKQPGIARHTSRAYPAILAEDSILRLAWRDLGSVSGHNPGLAFETLARVSDLLALAAYID